MPETTRTPTGTPTALVLGVGGNVSQGIQKALALSELPHRSVAACVSSASAGLYLADAAYISPLASDPAFEDWLVETCVSEGVDVVLSGVEPVLEAMAACAERLREEAGATAIVSPPETLEVGADKLRTAHWLEDHGFHAAASADAGDRAAVDRLVESCGFPLLAKPRRGKGSQGIVRVESRRDLEYVGGRAGYMVQELVGDEDAEFTAACFADDGGRIRGSIVMRRELVSGTTSVAEAGAFPEQRKAAERIAAELRPIGPCNVQLRMRGSEPVCFEINVRFSGTSSIRARLGFNDVEAAIRHYALGEPARDLPKVEEGIALRYWNEIYPDPAAMARIAADGRLDAPRDGTLVEDLGSGG